MGYGSEKKIKKPEILAPAGNPEKLRAAVAFGADAVYLAGNTYGMRSAAGNFTDEEMDAGIKHAHAHGVKVYVTVNTMPHTSEYPALEKYLLRLGELKPDALIISDPGVFLLARRLLPDMPLHVSTQASVVSLPSALAWYGMGAKRVILARELSLDEIKEITAGVPDDLEIEAFVHGSMCVSVSGRCLLSNYFTGRDANRGACAQPCRWEYKLYGGSQFVGEIEEVKRPGEKLTMVEESGMTYTFSSRDLCMIEHIPELCRSGLSCLKIEGRMKSACYTATVTNTYRMAIDRYFEDPENYVFDPAWNTELDSVCHRQYCTGFFFDENIDNSGIVTEPGYIKEQAALGVSFSYDKEKKLAGFIQKNKFTAGERLELLVPGKTGYEFTAEKIFVLNEASGETEEIASTPHPMMRFYLEIPFDVPEYSIIRYARQK